MQGFRSYAKPVAVDNANERLDNTDAGLFVYVTGKRDYRARPASARTRCLRTLDKDAGKLVPVRDYAARCVDIAKGEGFAPDKAIAWLSLHNGAKNACYILLRRDDAGNYVAEKRIDYAANVPGHKGAAPCDAGTIVFRAKDAPPVVGGKAIAKR